MILRGPTAATWLSLSSGALQAASTITTAGLDGLGISGGGQADAFAPPRLRNSGTTSPCTTPVQRICRLHISGSGHNAWSGASNCRCNATLSAPDGRGETNTAPEDDAALDGSPGSHRREQPGNLPARPEQLLSAAELLTPLLEGRPFVVAQLPGRGRGLVASRAISAGELVHEERPLLAFPALDASHQVCYHCLAAMPYGVGAVRHRVTGRRFCCDACLRAAMQSYLAVEAAATAASNKESPSPATSVEAQPCPGDPLRYANGSDSQDAVCGSLEELYEDCRRNGERFPLMAARLAFMWVSQAVLHFTAQGPSAASIGMVATAPPVLDSPAAGPTNPVSVPPGVLSGVDPLRSLHVLCYARLAPPYPDPWVAQHAQLVAALRALQGSAVSLRAIAAEIVGSSNPPTVPDASGPSASSPSSSNLAREQSGPAGVSPKTAFQEVQQSGQPRAQGLEVASLEDAAGRAVDGLTLEWYVGVLARLHLNVFQVHNPLAGCDPTDLAAAASALVAGTAGGASSGSAAYLLASLFNHSCEPSLDLAFPRMDGTASFTAARDIAPGEELTVSYLDVGLSYNARRQHLEWSYGFVCGCARCKEEGATHGGEQ